MTCFFCLSLAGVWDMRTEWWRERRGKGASCCGLSLENLKKLDRPINCNELGKKKRATLPLSLLLCDSFDARERPRTYLMNISAREEERSLARWA